MINFEISSEDSELHWPYLEVENETVLDLGCGRAVYHTDELQQSPLYLGEKLKAKKIIGIDGNPENNRTELDRVTNLVEEFGINIDNKYTFIWKMILKPEDLQYLITEYKITAIKCDIEGFETNFYDLNKQDMENVKIFALEYHTLEILERFQEKFIEWGFDVYAHGKFTYCDASQAGVLLAKK